MAHINKKGVWEKPDGRIFVTHFDDRDKISGESEEAFIERYVAKLKWDPLFADAVITIVDKETIPVDKTHRDCWIRKGNKVEVSPEKVQAKLEKAARDKEKKP